MTIPKIVTHTLVKNEERWIWYALQSVVDYVDEMLVWDTGSTDNTVDVIKSIDNPKIKFREYGEVNAETHTQARAQMVRHTQADWMFCLDGDEIWPEAAIIEISNNMHSDVSTHDYLISKYYNLLGDVFHHQEEFGGRYQIGPYLGHITIRAINMRRIPGLSVEKAYPLETFIDERGVPVVDRLPFRAKMMVHPYLHATHLLRSGDRAADRQILKRNFKYKYELGTRFPDEFAFPKPFYFPRPGLVASPWTRRSWGFLLNAAWQSPLKSIRRRVMKLPSGY